ncbi:hypothetical protein [Microbacterium sp. C7(2022)]|uniref:hypothetical protein n=1 Tax=Microbacterium sp. C7(2022) TaxID=2992759 RepID=UPI00237AE5A5|nr:hypothetical protein [Microbacterium sp. C7(2022)]MDE0545480.1 hypothetical protein [Microbacterium sp. C7(2022)]
MRWLWALRREDADDQDRELGKRGPVLDRDGEPVLGPDGNPLQKVLVVTRRDWSGDAVEAVWVDPRLAWQYDEAQWTEGRHGA